MAEPDPQHLEDPAELPPPPRTPLQRLWRATRELLLTLAFAAAVLVVVGALRSPDLPEAAPPVALSALDGTRLVLAEQAERTVVLNFWATWCAPCRIEMPALVDFAADHPEIPVWFLAVDGEEAALRAFAVDQGIPLSAVARADEAVLAAYAPSTIPMTVVVEPGGRLGGVHTGLIFRPLLWWMTR